jgi:hypothetical protein
MEWLCPQGPVGSNVFFENSIAGIASKLRSGSGRGQGGVPQRSSARRHAP